MLNGGGLNPGGITPNWPYGLPMTANAVFLNFGGSSNKLVSLVHHNAVFDGYSYPAYNLFRTNIDLNLDNGLGGVASKNQVLLSDTLNWGIASCKHANGRDWWLIVSKHNTSDFIKLLITPFGLTYTGSQTLNVPVSWYNTTQPRFSRDGNRFFYHVYDTITGATTFVSAAFDRCNGDFSNEFVLGLTASQAVWGISESPSGRYAYACSSTRIFQIDTDSLTVDTVAVYDGFISPPGQTCCPTTFWNMYLAANGKIYITSGSSVQHLHEMNYPDSAGVACDVQQHAIDLGSYLHLRAVPNHPNYNLGPVVGSVCDSLSVGLAEQLHDFHFGMAPNPVSEGWVKLSYLLPQNAAGLLEIYSLTGQRVLAQKLPPWSTLQLVQLPALENGFYTVVISSGASRSAKKLVVMR
jgi:hypothetical protein